MSDKLKLYDLLKDNKAREIMREIVASKLKHKNIEPTKEKVEQIIDKALEISKNKGV